MAKKEVQNKVTSTLASIHCTVSTVKCRPIINKQFVYLPDTSTWFSTIAGSASMLDSSAVLIESTAAG